MKLVWLSRKLTVAFCTAVLTASCAQPNYLANNQSPIAEQSAKTCAGKFINSSRCVSIVWEQAPSETKYVSFLFYLVDSESPSLLSPLNSDLPEVELRMPSMGGHGSAKIAVTMLGPGIYRATHVSLYMKGDWDIHFRFAKDGVAVDETKVRYDF